VAAALFTVVIGIVSTLPPRGTPGVEIADLGEVVATIGHAVAYALLGLAFGMAVSAARLTRSRMIAIVIILGGYGALLEVLQDALGSRTFQASDVLANAIGAILGVLLAVALRRGGPTA
jgi:VanZ family protein